MTSKTNPKQDLTHCTCVREGEKMRSRSFLITPATTNFYFMPENCQLLLNCPACGLTVKSDHALGVFTWYGDDIYVFACQCGAQWSD